MVKLSYSFKIKASFQQVWAYFSEFQNIQHYDPCVKKAQVLQSSKNKIGTTYDITTLSNGKQDKMIYKVTEYEEKTERKLKNNRIQIFGWNQKIQSRDEILLQQLPVWDNKGEYNLLIEYKAEMIFKGLYWFLTPFALGTLNKIAEQSEQGMKKQCLKNWGQQALESHEKKSLQL